LLHENKPLDFLDTPYIVSTFYKVELGTAYYWIFLRHEWREGRFHVSDCGPDGSVAA